MKKKPRPLNASSSLLMEKGRKAYFKIKKCIGFDYPCILLEKLFYALVSFFILYCSVLWGVDLSLKDSDPFEFIKFIKKFLVYIINQLMQFAEQN